MLQLFTLFTFPQFLTHRIPLLDTDIASSGRTSNYNNSNNNIVTGLVPTHWITGIFTGSLPPLQAAQVLDYAVLTNCNFAGIC